MPGEVLLAAAFPLRSNAHAVVEVHNPAAETALAHELKRRADLNLGSGGVSRAAYDPEAQPRPDDAPE